MFIKFFKNIHLLSAWKGFLCHKLPMEKDMYFLFFNNKQKKYIYWSLIPNP